MDRICTVLQTDEVYLYVTRSALNELDKLPKDNDIFVKARQFGLDECEIIENTNIGHSKNGKDGQKEDSTETSPSQDIINLVKEGNKNAYFIATQDRQLVDTLRGMVYIPLLWLTNGVLIFDTPSNVSKNVAKREERVKQKTGGGTMTSEEANLVKRLRDEATRKKRKEVVSSSAPITTMRKRKKAKEPNPLSCKKKKSDQVNTAGGGELTKKRRRRKKKSDVSEA